MSEYTLALDQSTQGTKALVIEPSSNHVVFQKALPHHQLVDNHGFISHNLNEILRNIKILCADVIKKFPPDSITHIALTNQRETACAWSRSTGKPLAPAIVWQCNRAEALVAQMTTPTLEKQVHDLTGLKLSPYFSAAKFAWLLRYVPAVTNAAKHHDLCFGTIDSWLLFQLTNGQSFATEPSNASRTQLFNLHTLTWDPMLCAKFGISLDSLAEIRCSDAKFGTTTLWDQTNPITIESILGDSQAALFAHNCQRIGSLKITFGTGSSIMLNIGSKLPKQLSADLNTSVGWMIDGLPTYVLEGNVTYAGAVLTWLKNQVHLIDDPQSTSAMAASALDSDTTVMIPAFTGLPAPYYAPQLRAAIFGMSTTTGRNEIVKAALESLCFQINDVLTRFTSIAPKVETVIHTDGGMINNQFLMQRLADLTDHTLEVPKISELSALGTAELATKLPRAEIIAAKYTPQMTVAQKSLLLNRWNDALRQLGVTR